MRRHAAVAFGLLLAALPLPAAVPKIKLVARDLEEKPLPGFRFAYAGMESLSTTPAGATELVLPPEHQEGRQIKIQLLSIAESSDDWFLVNPQINIPSGSAPAELVLMRRSAFRKLADAARDATGPSLGSKELSPEDKKKVLVETAARYNLSAEQLEAALSSFAETQDPKDQGIAAYLKGQYFQAEKLLQSAADKKEDDLVETLRYLGNAQYQQAKYQAAAENFRKAGAFRPDDTVLLTSLSLSLYELADWAEAEPLMRRALAIDEQSYGPDHPEVAIRLNNLASLLKATNRLGEAGPLMRRALTIDEKSYGPDHPRVAIHLNNLASLLKATNRLGEAEPLMRRALAIDEKSYGPDHPDVARDLNNLATLLQATNRLGEAEPLMRRALAIDEQSYGPDHPKVAIRLNNLAQLLHATNRLGEAEPLMRRALAIFLEFGRRSGHEHPNLQVARANYVALLEELGKSPVEVEAAIQSLTALPDP